MEHHGEKPRDGCRHTGHAEPRLAASVEHVDGCGAVGKRQVSGGRRYGVRSGRSASCAVSSSFDEVRRVIVNRGWGAQRGRGRSGAPVRVWVWSVDAWNAG